MKDIIGIIISIASFFTAISSLYISRRAFLISQGEIEFEMATIIKDVNYRVADLGLAQIQYEEDVRKKLINQATNKRTHENTDYEEDPINDITIDDIQLSEVLACDDVYLYKKKMHEQSIEVMLNTYDEACAKYLDSKVDKERFKRSYHKSIRNLIESGDFEKYFNTPCSSYKCILRVYDKWFNLEK